MDEETNFPIEEMDSKQQRVEYNNLETQNIMMKIAYSTMNMISGQFQLFEVISMLLAKVGEQPLRERWGVQFDEKMQKVREFGIISSSCQFFLVTLDQTQVLKETVDVTLPSFQRYRHQYCEASIYLEVVFDCFYTLLS